MLKIRPQWKIAMVCAVLISFQLRAQDSTRRAFPMIETMLEDAGEDRIGASVFLDEMEYYGTHAAHRNVQSMSDPLRMLMSSPLLQGTMTGMTDSLRAYDAIDMRGTRDVFPLGSEEGPSLLSRVRIKFRSTIENSFTQTKGLLEHKWDGSPVHSVQRLQIAAQPYSAGFLLEHDPGEEFLNGLAVGYVSVSDVGVLRQGIAGMFTVNSGEGLVLARSSLFSKGTISITQTKKFGATLVPYLSRDEFHYFRGAAAVVESGMWSFTGFISRRGLPATADESGTVTSFFTSGLFRTENEIKKFNAVTESSGGFIASAIPFESAIVTLTTVAAQYDKILAVSRPYAFEGKTMKAAGLSFAMTRSPLSLFGEFAGHDARSLSGIIGTIYRAAPNFSFSVNLRSYSDNYNNPFAHSFGEGGYVNGERGVYFGFDWNVSKIFGLFSYVDHFSMTNPDLFTRKGADYLVRADGIMAKNFTYSAQMKYKTGSVLAVPENNDLKILDDHRQTTVRLMLRYTSPSQYTLTQRCNVTRVSYGIAPQKEKGMLAATDIAKHYDAYGLGWKAGIVFFDTDSYDSGLSMYEPDVRGAASTSTLFGKGIRMFAIADYAPSRSILLSLKYSILSKWNEETLGSGDDEIIGNTDPQLTFQAEIAL
jgi:hypothetical protein